MTAQSKPPSFTGGMVVPLITPLTSEFEIDVAALRSLCEWHIHAGTNCIFLMGTTGEFYGLTLSQRAQVVDETLGAVSGRIPVICGISGDSTATALAAYHACKRKELSGYVASTPYFYEYSQDELADYFRCLSDGVGAPLILYNYPARYRHRIEIETVQKLLDEKRVCAIKDTAGDFKYLCELLNLKKSFPSLLVLESALQNLAKAAPMGVDGSVQALANLLPDKCATVWTQIKSKRFKECEQGTARLWAFHEAMTKAAPFVVALKACMAILGRCTAQPTRPTRQASANVQANLQNILCEMF